MTGKPYESLWDAVRVLESRSWETWRREHCPSLSKEETICQRLTAIETTVERRASGNSLVTVSILAKRVRECEVFPFILQRVGNRHYIVVEPVSTSS